MSGVDGLDESVWGGLDLDKGTGSAFDLRREQLTMIYDCFKASYLTNWEHSFLEQMQERLKQGADLTSAQYEKLEEVWSERAGK